MSDAPLDTVELVEQLVRRAFAARASDLHFEPSDTGLRVRLRVDSVLRDLETLPGGVAPNIVARLKVLSGLLTYRTDAPQEGAIPAGKSGWPGDVRVATFPTVRGERVVLRILTHARRLLRLEELGHDPQIIARLRRRLAEPQGLLLVCGPAGSGKTTTLFALLAELLAQRSGTSILTVEDPVELRLNGVTQVQIDPARGLTYPVALRSLLRQDPQVLMIGEVRDAETAQIAVEAALTGHMLLTTMHSGSPAEAILRLREMGLPAYQITSTLRGVLAQRLVRTICAACGGDAAQRNCTACGGIGFAGRAAIGQWCEMTPELRAAVAREADVSELERQTGDATLNDDAERLIAVGRTTRDEVQRVLGAAK